MNKSILNLNNNNHNNHVKWMFEALAVARLALELKEVPVGCVIVNKEDVIIGKGMK